MTFEDYLSNLEKRAQLPQYIATQHADSLLSDETEVRGNDRITDKAAKYINAKNNFITDVKTKQLNHSFGQVIDTSDLYSLLKEHLEESPTPLEFNDDYNVNGEGKIVHTMAINAPVLSTPKINLLYKINTFTENKLNSKEIKIGSSDITSIYSNKEVDGINHILYHNNNLKPHPISQRNNDADSGIFANTAFNPKKENGTVDIAEKEKNFKTHLRNYWKIAGTGNAATGSIAYGLGNMQVSPDNKYRERLIARLSGVSDSDEQKVSSKNFLAGPGVDTATYLENMGVGDLMSIGGLKIEESWQNHGNLPQSVLNDIDSLRYGTPEKRDLIIDSGRFIKNEGNIKTLKDDSHPEMGPQRRTYVLMRSSFAADAIRTPFYRRQMLALGNEVTMLNAFVDADRVSHINYRIGFIDEGADGTWSNNPRSSKHALWQVKDNKNMVFSSRDTPIGKLNMRFPDFMGNMYNVYFTVGGKTVTSGDGKGKLYTKEATSYMPTGGKATVNLDDAVKNYFNPDMFFSSVFAARCTGIQVKLPELKANSLPVLGRKVAYIDSNIIFSREGSLTIRLDETLDIYKGILSQAGVEYRMDKKINIFDNAGEVLRINNIMPQYNIFDNKRGEAESNSSMRLDIHIRYDMVNSMVPTEELDGGSQPFGPNGPKVYSPNGKDPYYREFVFTNVKFLGASDLELSKDSDIVEMSFPFVYADLYEAISGHAIDDNGSSND